MAYPIIETQRVTLSPGTESLTDNEWLVGYKPDGCIIGSVTCSEVGNSDMRTRVYIYCKLQDDYQNRGLGREILNAVLDFTFYGIKTERVLANARNCDKPACHILETSGFTIYNHVPKKKPDEPLSLAQFELTADTYKADHEALHTYDYVVPEKLKSPYTYDNPIRKIDSVNLVLQPTGYVCGQSVIAMLAGVTIEEVVRVMRNDRSTNTAQLRTALKYYGIKTATPSPVKIAYTEGMALPDCCILGIRMPKYGHWSLYLKGTFYDPEFGISDKFHPDAKLNSYWEIPLYDN